MKQPLFITTDGKLERHENTLLFENENQRRPIPIEQISEVYCLAHVSLTSGVIHLLAKREIPIHFFDHGDFYEATMWPRSRLVSGEVVIKQASAHLDREHRLRIAAALVAGAGLNLRQVLKTQARREQQIETHIIDLEAALDNIPEKGNSISALMGIEGTMRKNYYAALDEILPEWLRLGGRSFHPPNNAGNALVSFCNSLAYSACLSEIYRTQLDPTISFLHEPGTKRFSLSLDLAEIFKPAITDRIWLKLANRNQLDDSAFRGDIGQTLLSDPGRRLVIQTFQEKMNDTIHHRGLEQNVSYRRLIRLECYKMMKDFLLEEPYQPIVAWW